MTTTLSAVDSYNRQIGQAEFAKTWRYNEATDKREYGFKLLRTAGSDFGSIRFFFSLPIGSTQGLASGLVWRDDKQTFCY